MHTHVPPPHLAFFLLRLLRSLALAGTIVVPALAIGVGGYHGFEGLSYLDSLLNASMILSGMGPVSAPVTVGGKLFASFYALFSGGVFLTVVAVVLAPVVHRILHHFHWEMGLETPRADDVDSAED